MHTLTFDRTNSARPNTFHVTGDGRPLHRLCAYVRTTEQAEVIEVKASVQIFDRGAVRAKDPDGGRVLWLSRFGPGEGDYAVEAAQLHPDLPLLALRLLGWDP